MGEVKVTLAVTNGAELALFRLGKLAKEEVHALSVSAIVDTGAVETLLPREAVEKLGLPIVDKRIYFLADDTKVQMEVAGPLSLAIGDRELQTECVVGPPGCEALVGQIVMETLDLIVDPRNRTLTPRPESPLRPTLKLK